MDASGPNSSPPRPDPMRRRTRLLIQIAVAIALVAGLVAWVGVEPLIAAFANADLRWVVPAAGLIALGFVLSGLSVLLLYRGSRRGQIGTVRFAEVFFHSAFIATWLPGRIGDFSLAYLAREEVPIADSITYVLADKLITLVVLGGCTLVALDRMIGFGPWYWPAVGGAAVVGLPAGLWLAGRLLRAGAGWVPESWRERIAPAWDTVLHLARERRAAIAGNFVVTIVRLPVVGAALVCLLAAFGHEATTAWFVIDVSLATAAAQLLAVFPIAIQGIGVAESAYLVLLGKIGVSGAVVLASGLVGRIISVLILAGFHLALATASGAARQRAQ